MPTRNQHDKAQVKVWLLELVLELGALAGIVYGLTKILTSTTEFQWILGLSVIVMALVIWNLSVHIAAVRLLDRIRNLENRLDKQPG